MEAAETRGEGGDLDRAPHFAEGPEPGDVPAWERIDTGRYMPRRIRGSCRGRSLG